MKTRRFISLTAVIAICMSLFANLTIVVQAEKSNVYTADFTKLVKNSADTTYGTGEDVIVLDDYTTAYLTYEGTYVTADGKVYIKSGTVCNGNGKYAKGSYISFTAPSNGKLEVKGADIGWFEGNTYKAYGGSLNIDAASGTTYYFGYRKGTTYINSLAFTPEEQETPSETEAPSETETPVTETAPVYAAPQTTWDFDTYAPAAGGSNVPVISDQAEYDSESKNIKFPAAAAGTGTLTINFDGPINNNIEFEFDSTGHESNLGQQYINFAILNSEQEEIVSLIAHPYSAGSAYEGKNKLVIGGETVAADNDVYSLFGVKTTHVKITVDYVARTVTAVIGTATFNGTIPARTMKDISQFKYWVNRSKTAGGRYISLDNLSVKEFTSAAQPAADETLAAYESKTFANIPSRVKAPSNAEGKPLVIFLSSKSRFGTDNEGQLYQAQYFFDKLTDDATLAAPQTLSAWNENALKAYIEAAKTEYSPSEVVIIGYDEGATAAYLLSDTADKIVPIAGGGNVYGTVKAKYWVFGGFLDDAVSIAEIRIPVNALQQAGAKVRYTEYPTDGHNVLEKVGGETRLYEWIKGDTADKKVVDLVLFAGQSNMAGRGTASEATLAAPGTGYEFHSIKNPNLADGEVPLVLSTAAEPFGKNDNNSKIHDSGSNGIDRRSGDMVGAVMSNYYAQTGVPIVGVQASRGGQGTNYFLTNDYKTDCEERYKAAYKYLTDAGYTVREQFLVWCQGENDAEGSLNSSYKTNTLNIFNNMQSLGMTDMFLIKIGHRNGDAERDARYKQINEWQQELADENEHIYAAADLYTDEYYAQMRDQYHYYQPVYNSVGETVGKYIAEVYKDEAVPDEPEEKTVVMPEKPSEPDEPEEDIPGINLSWDFSTNQTAANGDNVPVISGAEYDSTNKMVKFAAAKGTKTMSVNLSPAADGVITTEFDAKLSSLGNTTFNVSVKDGSASEIVNIKLNTYESTGVVTIGGEEVHNGAMPFIKVADDGIKANSTHFKIEVNTAKRTVTVILTGSSEETYSGSISDTVTAVDTVTIGRTSSNNNAARHIYVDNLKISSYTPAKAIYAAGPLSVTKRIGGTTAQYSLSKTYTDDKEKAEWSVTGVTGVMIDKATGLLTVPENAGTGTAKVTVMLTIGYTMTAGTSNTIDVEIKDFAKPTEYKYDGSSTLEVGEKSQFSVSKVIDADGNDITEYATLGGFVVTDTTVAAVTGTGELTGVKAGSTELKFNLIVERLGYSQAITVPVKVGAFEITSSDAQIDVSNLINYGADTYRVYKSDKSYTDVTASSDKVNNTTGGEVTVVPVYRFNLTNGTVSGYTDTAAYATVTGFGLVGSPTKDADGSRLDSGKPFQVDLPYGSYDMNILRQGGARSDVYNDGIQIVNNSTSNGSQNRPSKSGLMYAPQILIADGSADITIGNLSGSNERIKTVEIVRVPDRYRKRIVWIAGDSESANYYPIDEGGSDLDSDKIMMTGFGMQMPKFLSSDVYKVANWGQPSATVKTWYDECFESVKYRMVKGDTLIIDFGINDSISSSNAISKDVMKQYMADIFDAAKAKGVQPILVSPVYNNKYQSKTYFRYADNTNEMYAFAQEQGVPCIDLNKGSQLYKDAAIAATGDSSWVTLNYHVGDNLHQTQHSALMNAAIITGGMKKLGYTTTDYSYIYKDISAFDAGDTTKRGTESGVTREYSIAALDSYITLNGADSMIKDFHDEEEYIPPKETPAPVNPEKDTITVAADKTVTVTLNDEQSGVLIRVKRQNGGLKSVDVYDNLTYTDGTAAKQIEDLETGDELYVWDSLNGMKPLADKKTVTEIAPMPTETEAQRETETPHETETPEPYTVLYSQDFEKYNVGDNGGWTSPAGTLAVKSDTTSGIGKYQTVVSGKSGTCRSGYVEIPAIRQNFVFECDYKSTSNVNVSDLELVEAKGSIYANHGVYSNAKYAFTMARPQKSDLYVINNKTDDSGLTLDRYTQPAVTSKEITGNPWLHVKVVGNFDTHTAIAYITSIDGKTEYYHGMVDMSPDISSWKCIHLLSPTTGADTCIDNIVVRTATKADLAPKYHKVKISLGASSFEQYVLDGESVVNIPSTTVYGKSFDGWLIGNAAAPVSTDTLSKTPINSDCEVTGKINANYIEALASVEFKDFPAAGELVMGADENTYGDNIISLNIVGEQGTSLVTNPDSRVQDYKIEWTFDGFRTLDGTPTGETGSVYCDSYGLIEITETVQSSVSFKLKKTAANYYGRVTAKVTYNGDTKEITRPLVLLGDKSNTTIIPRSGYTADFNKYESTMTGYAATADDIVTGGWNTSGSETPSITLSSDNGGKYLRINRTGTNSSRSSYAYQQIGDITGQTVFEQDVRFSKDGAIRYGGGTNTAPASVAFVLEKSGTNIKFNGTAIYKSAAANTWYHMVVTADPTSKLTYAKVYDMTGGLLGSSNTVAFSSSDYSKGTYYSISPSASSTVDINNVKIYNAETDASTITISGNETASIPESGSTTVKFTASAKTVDGADAIGAVTWMVDDELADGVSIASDGTLTIMPEASSGNLPIRATIGGKSAAKTIKLTGTRNNVAFTEAPLGIQLGSAGEYQYTAELRNGNAEKTDGTVTYSLANADGSTASYAGVSINAGIGKLSVTASATPQTIYVKATSGEYSRLAKTTLYALKFSFGTTAQSGYTQVTSTTSYSSSKGFGIEGTATNEASDITGSGVTFKVKLEKGKVYSVKAKYQGTIRLERVDSTFTGFDRTRDTLGEDTYSVAIFGDDVMDITLPTGGKIASVEITPVEKTTASKPDWWTIGDSTVQQNGSWGYTIASDSTTNLSKYPELAAVVNGFHNSGKAGEQHKNFYTNGRLNSILTQMNKGDVVSLSNMGTNDSSSTREQFYAYDEMYINAIMDMGGKVILGSYTPTGNYGVTQGKVYDADTMTFKGMRTNVYDLAIRDLYEAYKDNASVLGFVDIGKMADEKMTADVKAAYDAASGDETAKRTAANAKAEEMMAWWKDYNHYYTTFSNYILPDITKAVAELVKNR